MSLLKSFLQEMSASGSTCAGAIAVNTTGSSTSKKKGKKPSMFAGGLLKRVSEGKTSKSRKLFEDDDFDEVDAEAKLKNSEKLAKSKTNTKAFALEDDDGNTVKIYVKASEADEFEKELESAINSDKSVAEIVFELNKEFDIVDAEWGDLPEDEEESIPMGKPGADKGAEADQSDELGDDAGKLPPEGADNQPAPDDGKLPPEGDDAEAPAPEDLGSDSDVKSALGQIIDMLKSDIDAKKAEAEAKKAEAEAKKSEQSRLSHEAKAKLDAEMLDAEDYFKKKKDEEKEQRQMQLLAKYRHSKSGDDGDDFGLGAFESLSSKMSDMMFENFKIQDKKWKG